MSDGANGALMAGEQLMLANLLMTLRGTITLSFTYTNYRGATGKRRVNPVEFWYGTTQWHPAPGVFLKAFDLDKQAERDFALRDIDVTTIRVANRRQRGAPTAKVFPVVMIEKGTGKRVTIRTQDAYDRYFDNRDPANWTEKESDT